MYTPSNFCQELVLMGLILPNKAWRSPSVSKKSRRTSRTTWLSSTIRMDFVGRMNMTSPVNAGSESSAASMKRRQKRMLNQNRYLTANWMRRGFTEVLVMRPNADVDDCGWPEPLAHAASKAEFVGQDEPGPTVPPGTLNWGWLKAL